MEEFHDDVDDKFLKFIKYFFERIAICDGSKTRLESDYLAWINDYTVIFELSTFY